MKYLIEAAREYGLESIAEQAFEYSNVHGIIIDLHPLWLKFYKRHLRFPNDNIDVRYWYDYYHHGLIHPDIGLVWIDENQPYFQTTVPMNIGWYPAYWNDVLGNKNNLRVRIQLLPGSQPIEVKQENGRMTIVQEYSAMPEFSIKAKKMLRPLEGGLSIGHEFDPAGTLGGILVDAEGEKYGLTCGHVVNRIDHDVDQPSKKEKTTSGFIGSCVYSVLPEPNKGQKCSAQNVSVLNDMDIALIHLDHQIPANHSIINIGSVKNHTPANEIEPDLLVEFNGRTSGHQILVTGGVGFVQKIRYSSGEFCCFKNLIEIKQPLLPNLVLKRPVAGGDSGSWLILRGTTGLEWCGMIIGENRQAGYAIYSEDILKHLGSQGYNLACS